MNFIAKIMQKLDLTSYGLAKLIRSSGVEVTHQGIESYKKGLGRSIRLDVLAAARKASGLSWDEIGKVIDDEFLPKLKK